MTVRTREYHIPRSGRMPGRRDLRDAALLNVTGVPGPPPKDSVVPAVKFLPVIVTVVPPPAGPLDGLTFVIVRGAGYASMVAARKTARTRNLPRGMS